MGTYQENGIYTVLLTGFEPFGGSIVNPSQKVIQAMEGVNSGEFTYQCMLLPVDKVKAPEKLVQALDTLDPDIAICLGEAGGRARISIERVAINLLDYRIPDNSGQTPQDEPVVPGGPAAYFTTLPHKQILHALLKANIPAELSMTAGTYTCNQVAYTLMHHLAQNAWIIPAGFVHLPYLPEQTAALALAGKGSYASMSLDMMVNGIVTLVAHIPQKSESFTE